MPFLHKMRIQNKVAYRSDKLMLQKDVPTGTFICSQAAVQLATCRSLNSLGIEYVQVSRAYRL